MFCYAIIINFKYDMFKSPRRQNQANPPKTRQNSKFLIGNLGLKHFEFLCVWLQAFCVVAFFFFLLDNIFMVLLLLFDTGLQKRWLARRSVILYRHYHVKAYFEAQNLYKECMSDMLRLTKEEKKTYFLQKIDLETSSRRTHLYSR